jgi:hypothetical protein
MLQTDLNRLGKWAVENAMEGSLFHEESSKGAPKLYVRGHGNPGNEQL